MDGFGLTDRGVARDMNQDSISVDNSLMLYMVADGMGGHTKGEVASRVAVSTVTSVIRQNLTACDNESMRQDEPVLKIMREAVFTANEEIYGYSRGEIMGTTLSSAHFLNGKVYTAHIGDSRIYRLRGGAMEKLTEDHTEAYALVQAGILAPEMAENHRLSHVLTKALGASKSAEPDMSTFTVRRGDLYLLSSDGLFRVMSPEEVREVLVKKIGPREKCNTLLTTALGRGAPDNVSVIIVEVPGRMEKIFGSFRRRFKLHKTRSL